MTATPKTPEMIEHMLKELESPNRELTPYEENFLISITNAWEHRRHLTDKQFSLLERIYAEKTE